MALPRIRFGWEAPRRASSGGARDAPPGEPAGHAGRDRDVGRTADEQLVRTLYAEHAGPLLGYVLRLTRGDRQRAEDVVQETLVRARRHPEAVAPDRGPVRPWL
ncbi:MAG: sigma factor, partial [Carbonactinosporaceae bacterium]